jgi:hypothetical protein
MSKSKVRLKNKPLFIMKGDPSYIDRLDEDEVLKGKEWFIFSYLPPENIKNSDMRLFKIRDTAVNIQEAKKKADEFKLLDKKKFKTYYGQTGKWLPVQLNNNKTPEHAESELNDLMGGYEESIEKSKKLHEERTAELKSLQQQNKKTEHTNEKNLQSVPEHKITEHTNEKNLQSVPEHKITKDSEKKLDPLVINDEVKLDCPTFTEHTELLQEENSSKGETVCIEGDEPIKGKEWCIVSFLSPEGIKNTTIRGIKLRDVASDEETAKKKADEFRAMDKNKFHVFVGYTGKWIRWDPDPNSVKTQIYAEPKLNELMKGQEESMEKSKKLYEEHQTELKALQRDDKRTREIKERLKNKIREIKEKNDVKSELKNNLTEKNLMDTNDELTIEKEIENKEKVLEKQKEQLDKKATELLKDAEKLNSVESTGEEINKLFKEITGKSVKEPDAVQKIKKYYNELKSK